ncbi:Nodulin-like protein [Corchorus capsularis]|uniref:Nodulin-like protein n=1 Tax=Corchorus capsularis TaxID=210143 RepID=A0A1R3H4K0_COCAP|nr:Nodulin-like protein [Corchorus capsularis]
MANLKAGTRPPWVGLGSAVWVQIASGNAYTFPLYSHSLKSVLGFTQSQLTMLGVANDIGENVGLLPGIACNRFPPWIVLLIGGLACFVGYGVLWLAVSPTNSSAWLSTAVLVTNMRNFPVSRGTVAGILKGYGGLSAAVFTEIYSTVLRKSSSSLLMFLSFGVPILCFITMYFVRACTPASGEDTAEHGHFLFIQVASGVLGVYVLTTTVLDNMFHFSAEVSYVILAVMVVLLMAPLAIPVKMTIYPTRINKPGIPNPPVASSDEMLQGEGNADKTEPLLTPSESSSYLGSFREGDDETEVAMLLAVGEGAVKKKRRPKRGEDFLFSEAVIKADFWLLFLVYFVGVGSGVTVLNNLAQIGIAQGVQNTTILLSLFSFCNFLGRLGGGTVSEHFVRSRTIPRTIWMTCTQIIMLVTYLLFASAISGTLYAATALLGICYGVQFSIMIPTVSELFGLKHFGIFYNFMSLGNPLGAFLFSGLLAGYLYDSEAAKQGAGSSVCVGPNCFRLTFLVLAGLSAMGSVLSIILTKRIWPVYQMLYAGGSFRLPQTSNH